MASIPWPPTEAVELPQLAAQRGAVLAAALALAHVAACAAAGAHALVERRGDVEADVAARRVARLDRLDEADPRADEQRLDGRNRDAERLGELLVGEALHLAHEQRRALLFGQPPDVADQAAQVLAALGLLERVLQRRAARQVEQVDRGGNWPPSWSMQRLWATRYSQARSVTGRRRPAARHTREEDVLHRVLGVGARSAEHLACVGEQALAVALVDDLERVLVTLPEERNELLVGSHLRSGTETRLARRVRGCLRLPSELPPTVTATAGGSSVVAQDPCSAWAPAREHVRGSDARERTSA